MPAAFFRVESSIVTEASERTGGRIDHVAAAAVRLCLNLPFFPVSLPDKAGLRLRARHQVFEAGRQIPK